MRPAAYILLLLLVSAAAGIPLAVHYMRPRDISVCVLTDLSFRDRLGWETAARQRFRDVTRIYEEAVGIRWKIVSMNQWDPTVKSADLDARRADLGGAPTAPCSADVIVSMTGPVQGNRTGSVLPFGHAIVVVDGRDLTETQNTLRLANHLALLFGTPVEDRGAGTLMTSPPESERFSERAATLIRRLRGYDFANGTAALEGSWGDTVAKALAAAMGNSEPKPLARAHEIVGLSLEAEHHHTAAIARFREAVKIVPEDAAARADLAMALMQDAHPAAAIGELRVALQLSPQDPAIRTKLAAMLAAELDPNSAVEQLRKAIELNPTDANLQLTLGTILLVQMHRIDDAIASYQQALKLDPSSDEARRRLTEATLKRHQAEVHLADARARVGKSPGDAVAHYELAVAEAQMGDTAGAAKECEQALALDPNLGAAHEMLAAMRYFQEDYPEAWRQLKIASSFGQELPAKFTETIRQKAQHSP